jgi:hypothetical protein
LAQIITSIRFYAYNMHGTTSRSWSVTGQEVHTHVTCVRRFRCPSGWLVSIVKVGFSYCCWLHYLWNNIIHILWRLVRTACGTASNCIKRIKRQCTGVCERDMSCSDIKCSSKPESLLINAIVSTLYDVNISITCIKTQRCFCRIPHQSRLSINLSYS